MPVTENSDSLDKLSMESISPGFCSLPVFDSVWVLKLQSAKPNVTRGRLSIGRWISQWWGHSARTLKCWKEYFYDINAHKQMRHIQSELPALPSAYTHTHTVHPPAVWLTLQCEHKGKPCLHTTLHQQLSLNFSELMNTVRWEYGGPRCSRA